MNETYSPARRALMNESAKKIRSAIDSRDELMEGLVEKYDKSLEHGDDNEVHGASSALILFCTLDPVAQAIRNWYQLDAMLKRAEGISEG